MPDEQTKKEGQKRYKKRATQPTGVEYFLTDASQEEIQRKLDKTFGILFEETMRRRRTKDWIKQMLTMFYGQTTRDSTATGT